VKLPPIGVKQPEMSLRQRHASRSDRLPSSVSLACSFRTQPLMRTGGHAQASGLGLIPAALPQPTQSDAGATCGFR
jgi:hypothetical protein